ncbi:P-loop containing nucleoside triphosphate hydrolase protein [Lophiotrema nucula]|uniref:P-loop containing nucleoside triphosphate hydrolase protein n=1 Tax=Lophiotrema nucula TaxID=690887 RepID=A0A6A5YIA1_9PLEO|nr:P-loop containing nucleoside triphosphate hydrolase protein [Lophiotrema nucula]
MPATGYTHDDANQVLRSLNKPTAFSVKTLCAAIQNKCDIDTIKDFIKSHGNNTRTKMTISKDGWPALYYAAERNSSELLLYLFQQDIEPQEHHKDFSMPLLAFIIIHGHRESIDTTLAVKVLLAFGLDPNVIPKDMWIRYLETPLDIAAPSTKPEHPSKWCSPDVRPLLASSLHLTHRYYLNLACKLQGPTARGLQIAEANKMSELVKLPFFLIGQQPASRLVYKYLSSHVGLGGTDPLVLAFAGASGHGKTEMAKALGGLLSVQTTAIDCSQINSVFGLFGSTWGYGDRDKGSTLNNHLADNNGKRSVVFLDEFDKTDQAVRHALLEVFQSGDYRDKRDNTLIDCSKTIWILATNSGHDTISRYYNNCIEKLSEEKRDKIDLRKLQAELKQLYHNRFGAPLTGRVNNIVPFLPFTSSECAVIIHKFILNFGSEIRQPIDLQSKPPKHVGHCALHIVDDGKVCAAMTEQFYHKDLGGRSLSDAAKDIKQKVYDEYVAEEDEVTEDTNSGPLQRFSIRLISMGEGAQEVAVFPDFAQNDD